MVDSGISSEVKCKHRWALLSRIIAKVCSPFAVITENNVFSEITNSKCAFPLSPLLIFFFTVDLLEDKNGYIYARKIFIIILEVTFCWFRQMESEVLISSSVSASGRNSLLSVSTSQRHQRLFGVLLVKATWKNAFSSLRELVYHWSLQQVAVVLKPKV